MKLNNMGQKQGLLRRVNCFPSLLQCPLGQTSLEHRITGYSFTGSKVRKDPVTADSQTPPNQRSHPALGLPFIIS